MTQTQADGRGGVIGLAAAAGMVAFVLFFVNVGAALLLALIAALIVAALILLLLWPRASDPVPAKPPFVKPARSAPFERPVADAGATAAQTSETGLAAPEPDAPEPAADPGEETGAGEGSKPTMLREARAGGADNLKEIKGVGPKLEALLHGLGVFHFDQIAGWTTDEVAWLDANLNGFKGRVSRDDWVAQAQALSADGKADPAKPVPEGQDD